jgi:hypothetical protein
MDACARSSWHHDSAQPRRVRMHARGSPVQARTVRTPYLPKQIVALNKRASASAPFFPRGRGVDRRGGGGPDRGGWGRRGGAHTIQVHVTDLWHVTQPSASPSSSLKDRFITAPQETPTAPQETLGSRFAYNNVGSENKPG